jgi:hypothetical protein
MPGATGESYYCPRQDKAKAAWKMSLIMNQQRCGRYVILALVIFSVTVLAGICAQRTGISPYLNRNQSQVFFPPPIENQINGLTYYRYDPNTNRLCFMARAGVIQAENAKLGIFKTAAARTIKVQNLNLLFCDYPVVSALEELQTLAMTKATDTDKIGPKKILTQLADAHNYWSVDIDLSNPCKLIIDGFECRFFENNAPLLAVQSSRAIVDSAWPRLTLRGHVTITASDGATLESNHVTWDTNKQNFTVNGTYFLRHGTSQIAGRDICVDGHLNIAEAINARK